MTRSRPTTPFIPPMPGVSPGGAPAPGPPVLPSWTASQHRTPYRPDGMPMPPFDPSTHFTHPSYGATPARNGLGLVNDFGVPIDYGRPPQPHVDRNGLPDYWTGPTSQTENWPGFQMMPYPAAFVGKLPPGTPWYPPTASFGVNQQPLPGMPAADFEVPPAAAHRYPPGSTHSTPWHGGGYLPVTPVAGPEPLPEHLGGMAARPEQKTGIDTRWMVGTSYGPVLDPLHVSVAKCRPKVNPLLAPSPDDSQKRDYLTWNMLFSSVFAHRSNERAQQSWMAGRDAPATFPRLTSLRIISRHFPWFIDVRARNPDFGVTCGDVIDALGSFFQTTAPKQEFDTCSRAEQTCIQEAYYRNRSMADDVPGGRLGEGLRRCDFLGEQTMFDGIEVDDNYVRERMSLSRSQRDMPCIFVLNCERKLPMTADELRAERARGSHRSSREE